MAKKKVKWSKGMSFGKPTGWRKEDTQAKRRRTALRSRGGDLLATARGLQALANLTQDECTSRKAAADAHYFFAQYKKKQSRGGK